MDVLVVGAGVAGCQVARELAADHDVTVLDKQGVASGATGLSAGIVAPTLFYAETPDVARYANRFFREFDGTAGFDFTHRNRLDFVTEGELDEHRERAERLADEGFPVRCLDAEEIPEEYPGFTPENSEFVGAVEFEDTGWVDPYSYANALATVAEERGATIETGVSVDSVTVGDGAVTGVETDSGRYEADAVVLAACWRTQELLPGDVEIPIRPYRTQVLILEPDEPLGERFPLGRIGSEHLYFRPEHNGDLLIGGEHHLIDDPAAVSGDADESFKLDVAAFVPSLMTGFDNAGFVNGWAGVDAATPDTRPIIDTVGPDGLAVATGFNGLGVMASPVVGPTMRERLTGEAAPFTTEPFSLSRFDSLSPDFEYVSTSEV
ncbi:NAD(P)/FAD-dependent oxidoreductase [Halolamina sp.]|jgi:glycine/D-amino acid oxidase-like deaminating enzyme|uniref:NAD(P)/FAD-dependent oxidoreductase n=1 Tax=Halolamina sp. TaxID=1940283 RepID=UPI003569C667